MQSDILPVLAIGGRAVYIPYHTTRAHDIVSIPEEPKGYFELERIGQLPAPLESLRDERQLPV